MKPGPKRMDPAEKQAKGTYQACRDKPQHLIVEFSAPIMPSYLTAEAKEIWWEEIDRVVKAGIGEQDSTFFAGYCALEAVARTTLATGAPPNSALMTELRRRAEMLGIAGPASRALRGTIGEDAGNPFDNLPEA